MKILQTLASVLPLVVASLALGGPKYMEPTKPLSQDHLYFRKAVQSDYWRIAPHYLPQHNGKACGVASSVMVLNALRAGLPLSASDELFTSESLLKISPAYEKAVGKLGRGMDLDTLARNLQGVLDQKLSGKWVAEPLRFDGENRAAERKKLRDALAANEKNATDFLIANYLQGKLTGDPEGMIGHLSPIGAFDEEKERVLILDPDRQFYEPYWVNLDQLLDAINTQDEGVKKSRGLVRIRPKP